MLRAIIFDVDGTLAETEETHRAAFNAAFKEYEVPWHWDQKLYSELLKVTGGKERLAHYIATDADVDLEPDRAEALVPELHRRKTAIYNELIASDKTRLRPGIAELIESARNDGVLLAIATTTSHPNIETLLKATLGANALDAFETIAAGDDVPRKKPAPDVFQLALKNLRLPAEACIALEDSRNGLRAAMDAGLATLITPSLYTRDENFTGAVCIVNVLTDLLETKPPSRAASSYALIESVRRVHRDALARGTGRPPAEAL